jgi:hypothetical protein
MFKRRATGQRIFPSDPAAPSMAPAPAPMTTSDSILADLAYLHRAGDEEREDYANGEQPLRVRFCAPPGFRPVGYMFRRLSLRR